MTLRANGMNSFAYNTQRGHAYHKLGTPVDGFGTIDQMLEAAEANYEVELSMLVAINPNSGDFVPVQDHYATTRTIKTYDSDNGVFVDRTDILGVVGKGYTIEQNREAAQFAYDCVGASSGDAIIDTMGVMKNGAEFFAYLRLEPLVLDPEGVADYMEMGLAIRTSHNGSIALCAYPTAHRLVCRNTVTMSFAQAKAQNKIVKVRHTRNKDGYKADAVIALGIAQELREQFILDAQVMMRQEATLGDVVRTADLLWPIGNDPSKRAETVRDNRLGVLETLWRNEKNSGGFGATKWSAWQTIIEYLDHHRGLDETKRAYASATPDSTVSNQKHKAAQILLSV
jgi:phage/plasmid-like protein (TIGR03299 family)